MSGKRGLGRSVANNSQKQKRAVCSRGRLRSPGPSTKHRVGMTSRDETLARRIVRDVWAYTGGQAGRWAMLHSIARRLVLRDDDEIDRAVKLAKENGWVELKGLHSVRLTEVGGSLFGASDKR